ncbi:recombinase family protein [Halomonas sp. M4R5S39]|uniref:recombinase family protein n=1 Tax=Halomonas kalidii TaxID=3043293 RepID=UPI0024A8A4CA|nr:recombinase family protein [Halomonas kalidii]MDI5985308.1 recombinase family protein [Halomonas kalidii]
MVDDQQQCPKAYSYLRFSTPEQMKGDSFSRQARLAQEYADRHGLDLDEHSFEDFGISAYQGRNREAGALRMFLRAAEDGTIEPGSYLLVESLDRISRQSARKASTLLGDICDMGITVVTLFDGKAYDKETLDRDPVAFIMAVLIFMRANEESATKARRLRSVWQNKRQKIAEGESVRLTSRAPQWLRPADDGVSFEIIPERGEVVRRIFEMALDGVGKKSIAERLNNEGVPVFGRGQHWHPSYIDKILNNPATYGTLTPFTSRPERKSDREACEPVEGYYPTVIDREIFERFQSLKASKAPRRGRHSKKPLQNILGGLATCPLCGSIMARVSKNVSKGWVYLACQRARQGAGCKYNAVRYDLIEPAIHSQLGYLIGDCPTGDDSLDEEIEQTRNSLEGVEGALSNVLESIENGLTPERYPSIGNRLADLQDQRDELKDTLAELLQRQTTFSGDMATRRAVNLGRAVRDHPDDKTLINSHMRECFSKVVVDFLSGELVFHWKHGGHTHLMYKVPAFEM